MRINFVLAKSNAPLAYLYNKRINYYYKKRTKARTPWQRLRLGRITPWQDYARAALRADSVRPQPATWQVLRDRIYA